MGKVLALSGHIKSPLGKTEIRGKILEFKKPIRPLPKNVLIFRPLVIGIGPDGNRYICNYLREMNHEGVFSDLILNCLFYIFRPGQFELVSWEKIDGFIRAIKPDDIDISKTEEILLRKANEENSRLDEYAQAYVSYVLCRHAADAFCKTQEDKALLKKWHSYILCIILPDVATEQTNKK